MSRDRQIAWAALAAALAAGDYRAARYWLRALRQGDLSGAGAPA